MLLLLLFKAIISGCVPSRISVQFFSASSDSSQAKNRFLIVIASTLDLQKLKKLDVITP